MAKTTTKTTEQEPTATAEVAIAPAAKETKDFDKQLAAMLGTEGNDSAGFRLPRCAPGRTLVISKFPTYVLNRDRQISEDIRVGNQWKTKIAERSRVWEFKNGFCSVATEGQKVGVDADGKPVYRYELEEIVQKGDYGLSHLCVIELVAMLRNKKSYAGEDGMVMQSAGEAQGFIHEFCRRQGYVRNRVQPHELTVALSMFTMGDAEMKLLKRILDAKRRWIRENVLGK